MELLVNVTDKYGTYDNSKFLADAENGTSVHDNTSNAMGPPGGAPDAPASQEALICLSILFCTIGLIGLVGNAMVIFIILSDKKMRRSVTNLFIMNLALADFVIMLFGIPEIIQFILNRGWLLGLVLCKFQRYVLVVSLFTSIMTLVAVCVERYIAIVHPIKAHIFCSRRRIMIAIACIWPVAFISGLPTVLFNQVLRPHPNAPEFCSLRFPGDNETQSKQRSTIIRLIEFGVYFLSPVCIQIAMYTIVCKRLFVGTERLHRKQTVADDCGGHKEKDSDAIKARKGVVKMLIASVVVYFLSYAPAQVPPFYDIFSPTPFKHNWSFLVLVMTLAYVNSAANPILYGIFSQNFRRKFHRVLCCCAGTDKYNKYNQPPGNTVDKYKKSTVRFSTTRVATTITSVSEM